MNREHGDIRVAVAVPIFPNLVQTYVLNQLNRYRQLGVKLSIIASVSQHYDELPTIVTKHDLLSLTRYTHPNLTRAASTLTAILTRPAYWRVLFKLLTCKLDDRVLPRYRLKSLLRASVIDVDNIDILHSHSLFSSYNLLFLKTEFGIPLVTTYHGQVPRGVPRLGEDQQALVLEHSDLFFVNTGFARQELIGMGCDADKIRMVPQGLVLNEFVYQPKKIPAGNSVKLLTVSRLSPEKGHRYAIEAVARLVEHYPDIEYHVVGDGVSAGELEQQVEGLGLQKQVIFHGFRSGQELKDLIHSSHIFILPSINTGDGYLVETQGVVLQEAQCCGVAVIGSITGGIPDVIEDGDTGMLFEERNSAQLADKVRELIENPDLYDRMLSSARKDMEARFDIEVIAENWLATYRELIDTKN